MAEGVSEKAEHVLEPPASKQNGEQQNECCGEENARIAAAVADEDGASDWTSKRDLVGSLFPGIPDDIAIEHILTKVTWKSLCVLSTVSRGLRQAMQSRQVHRARMRNKLTRTLVSTVHMSKDSKGYAISLYDPADFRWLLLPPIPDTHRGIPYGCGCVVLNGELYVLGGLDDDYKTRREVYKLDLAGCKRVWEKCASMRTARELFPCVVKDEKIYVFEPLVTFSGEMFDPELNVWCDFGEIPPAAAAQSWRTTSIAATVDEEIFVHANEMYQVYNPYTGAWRQVRNPLYPDERHTLVVVNGELYDLLPDSVEAYSVSSDSWTCIQRISYHFVDNIKIIAAVPLDGELLTLFTCLADGAFGDELLCATYKSTGFGRHDCNLVWSRLLSPFQFLGGDFNCLCTIEL